MHQTCRAGKGAALVAVVVKITVDQRSSGLREGGRMGANGVFALSKFYRSERPEIGVPGPFLGTQNDQRFFLSTAQASCGRSRHRAAPHPNPHGDGPSLGSGGDFKARNTAWRQSSTSMKDGKVYVQPVTRPLAHLHDAAGAVLGRAGVVLLLALSSTVWGARGTRARLQVFGGVGCLGRTTF